MEKQEENTVKLLVKELNEILDLEQNKEAKKTFQEVTKNLKPVKCDTKTGWSSGEYISFSCMFTKDGEGDIFEEIVKGIPEKKQEPYFYFLMGLCPHIFHFDTKLVLEKGEHFFLTINLKREDKNGKEKQQ